MQLAEGVEGMIHVGDISAEKRINHPQDVLKVGQVVKAQVLEVDTEKRRLRLGMKQLVPTSLDEYIAEHKEGDVVTGRMMEVSGGRARVELGEGVQAACRIAGAEAARQGREGRGSQGRPLFAQLDAGRPSGRAARRPAEASASPSAPARSAASASSSSTPLRRRSKSSWHNRPGARGLYARLRRLPHIPTPTSPEPSRSIESGSGVAAA